MRKFFPKISSAIISTLLSLFLLEILIRTFLPHPRYEEAVLPSRYIGRIYKPDHQSRGSNMFGEYDTKIITNHEGFRDRNHSIQKTPGTLRIAFMGDSFTCAEQVEDEQTFVRIIERDLPKKIGRPVECMNFGIAGLNTQEEVLCYEHFIAKYHPDIVLLEIYPRNDFMGNLFYENEDPHGRPYFKLENEKLIKVDADPRRLEENYQNLKNAIGVQWYQHLQTYNAFKRLRWEIKRWNATRSLLNHPPDLDKLWKIPGYSDFRYYLIPPHPSSDEANHITQLLLQKLQQDTRANGSEFFTAVFPAYSSLWPERWPERIKVWPGFLKHPELKFDFQRAFKSVDGFLPDLKKEGKILDLRPPLRIADDQKSIFFKRDNHYNSWGHENVGKAMTDWLAQHLQSTKPTP